MGTETEPAKLLLPYLQRADELQKPEPLVAYYCRLYAMERGLKIPAKERTKMTSSLLISIMNQLEKDKKSLELGPEDNLYVEGFASNVFARADKQDRAGRADLNTAKTFYAASIFFEILNQFGPLQPDIEQKQKYAVWKAADIRKALKEGRTPAPGPPGDDDELSILSSGTNDNIGPSEPPSTNYRSDPDPSQFRDSKNYRSEPDPSQFHDSTNYRNEPDPSPFHDSVNDRHSTNFPPPSKFHDNPKNEQNPTNIPGPAFQYHDKASNNNDHQSPPSAPQQHHYNDEPLDRHLASFPSVPQTYPAPGYSSRDDFPPSEPSDYPHQPYHQQQSYGQDQPPPQPHHLQPHSSFPHFQSYPSFSESSLPVVPPNFPPPYYQGSDGNFAPASNLPAARLVSEPAPSAPAPVPAFEYDCNYMPPPEKITEAHKAARFAVGALAFDDVSVAVDYLRKSLELLTNPSAKSGQWT